MISKISLFIYRTHSDKSSILAALIPESAELAGCHLEQVDITPMVDLSWEVVPDKAELEEDQVSVKTEDHLLAYIAAAATIAGGVLHLLMIGPFLKPANFPMQLLLYTHTLFIVAGLAQVFWALPMIKRWGLCWYYFGILGTAALSKSLIFTRVPNGITSTALIDTNPMALLTEISQFVLFVCGS
jgi:hypothetical protein